ncbi:metallophosphoesterase family protein [Cryobacterium sp. AP23]
MSDGKKNRAPHRHTLEAAPRIGLIGDLHGDIGALLTIADNLREREIDVLLALGDVGVPWPGENSSNRLSKVSKRLASRSQTLYFVDGNHDDHRLLRIFQTGSEGPRELRPNIFHLPRGYRTVLGSGMSLAALGGANSIDVEHREEDVSWWPQESITDDDLEALGQEHADILVGHDAPLDVSTLDAMLADTDQNWSSQGLEYARRGRQQFHTGFLQVTPRLYLGGHYHLPVDETVGYFDGRRGFAARVVLLDMVQSEKASSAILDTASLNLEFFTTGGRTVPGIASQATELTVGMGGRWMVHTLGSRHVFDLDRLTVERLPGPYSKGLSSDGIHQIRSLDTVQIGSPGRWTMHGDALVEYYWHVSSVIRHIQHLPPLTEP